MIVELLNKYHVDEFDDLLIKIIKHMKEQKETRQEDEDDNKWRNNKQSIL